MVRQLAAQPWQDGVLVDAWADDVALLGAEPLPMRLPPLLAASASGTLWLHDRQGHVLRGGAAGWQALALERAPLGIAPQDDGGAVLLEEDAAGTALRAIGADGRTRWQRSAPGGRAALLADEAGRPYLHLRTAAGATLARVATTSGSLDACAELPGEDGPLLVRHGALWRIRLVGGQRHWLRRPFGGGDESVLAGGALEDTFLMAVALHPRQGPVLTDGQRLLALLPGAEVRPVALPQLPPAAPPPPAVLDLLNPVARPEALWVVYADGAGWAVHELPLP